MKRLVVVVLLMLLVAPASAQPGSVMGVWLVASGKAQVRISPCDSPANGPVCGVIVGLINPTGPNGQVVAPDQAVDFRNPDPNLRGRKVIGMPLIWGFKKTDDPNAFEEGHIYNGENGKVYTANISLQPDGTLKLRGYVGSPLFGETQIWTRVQ
jgi:uncharacterized protein (DUF2147 family)